MRPSDCLPSLEPGTIATSEILHVGPDPDDPEVLPEDLIEVITEPDGRVAHLAPPAAPLRTGRPNVFAQTWVDGDRGDIQVIVKMRDRKDRSVLAHRAESAVYRHSAMLSPRGNSIAEDLNSALAAAGHPGRVPVMVSEYVRSDSRFGPSALGLVITRLEGTPLAALVAKHLSGLPPQAAAAIVRSLCHFVAIAHSVGVRLGDINGGNVLVCGSVDEPATLFVQLVDLEMADHLGSVRTRDRETWVGLVDPHYRWRVTSSTLTDRKCATERLLTWISRDWPMGFETDLGFAALMSRLAFTGSAEATPDTLGSHVSGPLRWALSLLDHTGHLASERPPELADAAAFGCVVADLAPIEREAPLAYLARVESVMDRTGPGLVEATIAWAAAQPDPAMRLASARLRMTRLAATDASHARLAADTFSSVWAQVSGAVSRAQADRLCEQAAIDAGLVTPGQAPALIAGIAVLLSRMAADRDAFAAIERIWPQAVIDLVAATRPRRDGRRHPIGSSGWLDQFVAHSARTVDPAVKPGTYSIVLEDDRDRSFTIVVDGHGHVSRAVRGTTLKATALSNVTLARLADHVDGTAWFPKQPPPASSWRALDIISRVAPHRAVRRFSSNWPTAPAAPAGPRRFGTREWLEALLEASARQPTDPAAAEGTWAVDVVDDPATSFTFTVGPDRRIEAVRAGLHADADHTEAIHRERLLALLDDRPDLPRGHSVAVLCAAAGPVLFTDRTPLRLPFLSRAWLTEVRCTTTGALDVPDVDAIVVPAEDRGAAFELVVRGRRLERLAPAPGRDGRLISAPRLWDVIVVGGVANEGSDHTLRALAALGGPHIAAMTARSNRLSVPPGEAELLRLRARAARRARITANARSRAEQWLTPSPSKSTPQLDRAVRDANSLIDRLLTSARGRADRMIDDAAEQARRASGTPIA